MKVINIICKRSAFNKGELVLSTKVRLNNKTSTYRYSLGLDTVLSVGIVSYLQKLVKEECFRGNSLIVIEEVLNILKSKKERESV